MGMSYIKYVQHIKVSKLNKKAKVYVYQLSLSRQYLYCNKEEWHCVPHNLKIACMEVAKNKFG